jgi:4-hydroxybenzoate polyprenyltransferase
VSSHLLKLTLPAALLSAAAVVLTLGVAAAQAAIVVRGRGITTTPVSLGHSGTNVGLVVGGIVALAIVVGGIAYAVLTDRRLVTPATAAVQPTPLPSAKIESEQKRKAA